MSGPLSISDISRNLWRGDTIRLTAIAKEDYPALARWYQDAGFLRLWNADPARPQTEAESGQPRWSDRAGFTVWLCYDLEGKRVLTEPGAIASLVRSEPDTPRHCAVDRATLSELRKKAEKQAIADYLRPLQAPVGVSPILKCWMELN